MAAIVRQRAHIVGLVFGAALWCTLVACTGPLVYRPEKKAAPDAATIEQTDGNLPPVPDPKVNDATLAGIDTAAIGIRDDVHLWIYANYTTTVKRTILMTMAQAIQNMLVTTPRTTEEARGLAQSYKDASMMLRVVRGLTKSEAAEMDQLLYLQVVDTPERMKAYLQYDLLLEAGKGAH